MTKTEKDAALLRDAWDRAGKLRIDKGEAKLSQKELAGKYHTTPGNVSHYFRGREPLNVKWQLRFAEYLDISPGVIWPDFPHKNLAPGKLPQEAMDLALDLLELTTDARDAVRSLMRSLPKKRA